MQSNTAATDNLLIIHTRTALRDQIDIIQLRTSPKAIIDMSSEQPSTVILATFFRALTFGPLIAVSVIILLATLLKILDALSSLSFRIAEDRARRGIDVIIAQSMENGMVQNQVVESGMIDQPQISLLVANMGQGPRSGEGAGSTTEELLIPNFLPMRSSTSVFGGQYLNGSPANLQK